MMLPTSFLGHLLLYVDAHAELLRASRCATTPHARPRVRNGPTV